MPSRNVTAQRFNDAPNIDPQQHAHAHVEFQQIMPQAMDMIVKYTSSKDLPVCSASRHCTDFCFTWRQVDLHNSFHGWLCISAPYISEGEEFCAQMAGVCVHALAEGIMEHLALLRFLRIYQVNALKGPRL